MGRQSNYQASPLTYSSAPTPITDHMQKVGVSAFFRMIELWTIGEREALVLLGQPSRATFYNWKKGVVRQVPYDTMRRISYLLGIYKALQILFKSPEQADAWLHKENAAFGGQSALQRLLGGDVSDLAYVRHYLDAVRGSVS